MNRSSSSPVVSSTNCSRAIQKAPQLEHSMGSPCDDVFLTGGCYILCRFFLSCSILLCNWNVHDGSSSGSIRIIGIERNLHDNNSSPSLLAMAPLNTKCHSLNHYPHPPPPPSPSSPSPSLLSPPLAFAKSIPPNQPIHPSIHPPLQKKKREKRKTKPTLLLTSFSPSPTFPLSFNALTFRSTTTSFSSLFSARFEPALELAGFDFRFSLRSAGAFRPRRRASSAASAWEAAAWVLDNTGPGARVGEVVRGICWFGGFNLVRRGD